MPEKLALAIIGGSGLYSMTGLTDASPHARACPEFPDADYLESGVLRVFETSLS